MSLADLPFVLQGLSAPSFRWNSDFTITTLPQLPPNAAGMTHILLEPAVIYQKIVNLQFPEGLLYQALWDCVDWQLQKYRVLLGGLERRSAQHKLTLIQCYDMVYEAIKGLRALWAILARIKRANHQHIFTCIHPFTCHGDPFVAAFAQELYTRIKVPLQLILDEWLTRGTLNDPFNEFFIEFSDPESVWADRFRLNSAKLPHEITVARAQEIYESGKSIYFLRELCQDLTVSIDAQQVTKVLIQQYDLRRHLQGLYDYLLLTRGDFVASLLAESLPVLSQYHDRLYRHELVSILENAIGMSNARSDPPHIISCLDARMLELGHKERGWEVFTLEYKVETPLDIILDKQANRKYLQIFNYLWSLRWAAANLHCCYTATNSRSSPFSNAQSEIVVKCWRIQADTCQMMMQFLNELQGYIYSNIIESAWKKLMTELDSSTSVDAIINFHRQFLKTIAEKALFGGGQVVGVLHEIIKLIVDFRALVDNIMGSVAYKDDLGFQTSLELLEELQREYVEQIRQLIMMLDDLTDDVKSFSTRINFNGYYFAEE